MGDRDRNHGVAHFVKDDARIFHAPRFSTKAPDRIECNCAWKAQLTEDEHRAGVTARDLYVRHLPLTARKRGLRINLFGGDMGYFDDDCEEPRAGCWILPAYDPVAVVRTYEADSLHYGITEAGETLPILWIKLQDGRIFQTD